MSKVSKKQPQRKYEKTDQLTHIRKRPDTYVGSKKLQKLAAHCVADVTAPTPTLITQDISYIPAMLRIFVEIISNAIDNIYRSDEDKINMTKIKIDIDKETGETSVWNDGTWIPLDKHEDTGLAIPHLIFGELLTSDNYDDTRDRQGSGRNGYGAKLTNVFSTEFKIEIAVPAESGEGLEIYRQTWTEGMTKVTKAIVTKRKTGKPYTRVTYTPDFAYFGITEYSEDIISLYYRYIYDSAMIAGCSKVAVWLDGKKIPISNLKEYAKLFTDSDELLEMKTCNSTVVLIPAKTFNFSAFTNGVHNSDGGVHLDLWSNAIFRPLMTKFNTKGRPQVSMRDIKQFFRILIKCDLPSPEFSSQSKTYLTSPSPEVKVTTKNISALMKWDFAEKVKDIIKGKELLTLKKIERKKKTFQKIPGYDPANLAGGPKASECILIFTEGLSAKAYAARGIDKGFVGNNDMPQIKGRDYFGLFPLRGKLLNVKNAKTLSIANNKEIKNAIAAINLRINVDYTIEKNFKTLQYGKIAILCDADVDGIHIKGLLINMFHTLFPTLLKREDPFIISMETPIVRVFEGRKAHVFYDETKYKEFIARPGKGKLRKKYYKGLGTSSNKEVMETFGERVIKYTFDEEADTSMAHLFKSAHSNERKLWLGNYDPANRLPDGAGKVSEMTITDFINYDMIKFSIDDCGRSIPHLLDGLKESQRKIMYSVFKKKLTYTSKTLKVAQLSGYVAEHSGYHHGEQCLYDTIIKLANDIVGMNNIPLLFRDGQYGTRLQGGKDAAAGRYIFTKADQLTRLIFPAIDDNLLPRHRDDGDLIEPMFYIPVIPMILVNGCTAGIGTGWSCSVPTYNPLDLISSCKKWITKGDDAVVDLHPWFRNFKGTVTQESPTRHITTGVFERKGNKVTISELPIGMWTDKYKEFLEDMLEKKIIKSLKNYSTPQVVKFVITESRNGLKCTRENLKLTSAINTTNMVLFTPKGKLRKFKNTKEIIINFCKCRLSLYNKRREYLIKIMEKEVKIATNKMRYLDAVMNETLIIFKRSETDIVGDMETMGLEKIKDSYDYLLNLTSRSFSQDKLDSLQKEIDTLTAKLEAAVKKTGKECWLAELATLKKEYTKWKKKMAY